MITAESRTASCDLLADRLEVSGSEAEELFDLTVAQLADAGLVESAMSTVGVYRVGERPSSTQELRLRFMWLELTAACNERCLHCYSSSDPAREAALMSRDDWERVISEAAAIGVGALVFIGGEPLCDPALPHLVLHAKERGIEHVEVFTNGTLLTEEVMDALGDGVRFSTTLYSHDASLHDSITGFPGSHDRTMRAIRLVQIRKLPLRVSLIAMKENQEELTKTIEWAADLGIPIRRWDVVRPTGRGGCHSHLPDDPGVLRSRYRTAPDFFFTRETFELALTGNSCWAGKLCIAPDGRVLPCTFGRGIALGNVLDSPLGAVVASAKVRDTWHITNDDIERCCQCEFRYVCRDCRPLAMSESGGLFDASLYCTYTPTVGVWGDVQSVSSR
jgi:radical SAM protein with 4Fe4S-binding SPASM domain